MRAADKVYLLFVAISLALIALLAVTGYLKKPSGADQRTVCTCKKGGE